MSDDMIARARRIVDDKRNQTHLRPWAEALLAEREAREQAEARVAALEAALCDEVDRFRAALTDICWALDDGPNDYATPLGDRMAKAMVLARDALGDERRAAFGDQEQADG